MTRLSQFAALFVTIVSFTVLAHEVQASSPTRSRFSNKQTLQAPPRWDGREFPSSRPRFSNKLQTLQGFGSTSQPPRQSGSPSNRSQPTIPVHVPPGGWKVTSGLFNNNPQTSSPATTTEQEILNFLIAL